MRAIILREYFSLKHNLISFVCIWALMPMMTYLLVSIPFSFYINIDNGINYLNWSSIGNWVCTSSVMTYLIAINLSTGYRLKENSSRAYLYSHHSNFQHLIAIIIWSSIMGFVQLIFSLLITLSLNSGNLFFFDMVLIIFYMLPIISFVSVVGISVGMFMINKFSRSMVSVALFLFMAFSSGLFLPLDPNISNIFLLSPLYLSVSNIQAIMSNDPSMVFASVLLLILSIILFLINLILSHKFLRS